MAVTLPSAFEIDQRHLGNICAKSELVSRTNAPAGSRSGRSTTKRPLLEKPLEGPAYAVSGYGGLPIVAFILGGQVTVIPQGKSTTVGGGRLRTEVATVPDVPIGHFQLTLFGGKRGYLANTRSLCAHTPVATVEFKGQNGKKAVQRVALKASCGSKGKH